MTLALTLALNLAALMLSVTAVVGQQQSPAPCLQKPAAERAYNKERLLALIHDQTPARAEYLIRACGVALVWAEALAAELKAANTSDKVMQAVRDVTARPKPVLKGGDLRTNRKDGAVYAYIPPGTFEMGCADCDADERPVHQVRLTKGYWMAQTEVRVGAYQRFAKAANVKLPPEPKIGTKSFNEGWANDAMPMSMVTWNDARTYCQWAGMRLPTEAEWEYAARGPAGAASRELPQIAWFSNNSGTAPLDGEALRKKDPRDWIRKLLDNGNGPHAVALQSANGWKLHDMLGNVWEWTADWYRDNAYTAAAVDDPTGPAAGFHHVLRGGSWLNVASYVRPSKRLKGIPDERIYINGFRCAGATIQ